MHRIGTDAQKSTGTVKNSMAIELRVADNCWICEGWTEVKFEFESEDIDVDIVPVKLHVSCDNYLGELLDMDTELTTEAQIVENERVVQLNITEGIT